MLKLLTIAILAAGNTLASESYDACKTIETDVAPFYSVVYYAPGKSLKDMVGETYYRREYSGPGTPSQLVSIPYPLKAIETFSGAGELDPQKTKTSGALVYKVNPKIPAKAIARGSLVRISHLDKATLDLFKTEYSALSSPNCVSGKFTVLYSEATQAGFAKLPKGIVLAQPGHQGLLCNHSLIPANKKDPMGRADLSNEVYLATDNILTTKIHPYGPDAFQYLRSLEWIAANQLIRPHKSARGKYVALACPNKVRYVFDRISFPEYEPTGDPILVPLDELDGRIRPFKSDILKKMVQIRNQVARIERIRLGHWATTPPGTESFHCTPDGYCHLPGVVGEDVLKKLGWENKDIQGGNGDIRAVGPSIGNVCYAHYTNDKPINKALGVTSTLWMNPEVIGPAMDFACRWKDFCNATYGQEATETQCLQSYQKSEERCYLTQGVDFSYFNRLHAKSNYGQKLSEYENNFLISALQKTNDCRVIAARDFEKCQSLVGSRSTRCILQLGDAAHPSLGQTYKSPTNSMDVNGHEKHVMGTKIDIRLFSYTGIFAPKQLVRNQVDYQLTADFLCWAWEDPNVEEIIFDYKGNFLLQNGNPNGSPWISIYDYVTKSDRCITSTDRRVNVKQWLDNMYRISPGTMTSHDDHIDIKFTVP